MADNGTDKGYEKPVSVQRLQQSSPKKVSFLSRMQKKFNEKMDDTMHRNVNKHLKETKCGDHEEFRNMKMCYNKHPYHYICLTFLCIVFSIFS